MKINVWFTLQKYLKQESWKFRYSI
jgi:hypothetical protein